MLETTRTKNTPLDDLNELSLSKTKKRRKQQPKRQINNSIAPTARRTTASTGN
jgi:hypothetical protein